MLEIPMASMDIKAVDLVAALLVSHTIGWCTGLACNMAKGLAMCTVMLIAFPETESRTPGHTYTHFGDMTQD